MFGVLKNLILGSARHTRTQQNLHTVFVLVYQQRRAPAVPWTLGGRLLRGGLWCHGEEGFDGERFEELCGGVPWSVGLVRLVI